MSPFECLTMAGQSQLRCDLTREMDKSSSNDRFTTITIGSLILVLTILLLSNFQFVFIRYRHGWCGAKALSPRHAIVAVVKHGHLMTVIPYHLEVMKQTIFFFKSHLSF